MSDRLTRRTLLKAGSAGLVAAMLPTRSRAASDNNLRAVMHAPLRVTDPAASTAWSVRNHGLQIYDTLFALDSKFVVRPQMVDSYEVSSDGLLYTFVLRSGLRFHDGSAVTSSDVIPSLARWAKRDVMGTRLMTFVAEMRVKDDRTFQIVLRSPYGNLLQSLAKPSSIIPFILPARLAVQPPEQAITEHIGSGPFRFVSSEFRPGSFAAYERNELYVPRQEQPDGMAGGKHVRIARCEWISMPDMQIAANALRNQEIDFLEVPPHDLLPMLAASNDITIADYNPLGFLAVCRINWLTEPFNREDMRRALLHASNQGDWLQAQIGNPDYYRTSAAMFGPGTPFASEAGWNTKPDLARARELVKKSGYDGSPIVLLQGTDSPLLLGSSTVTAQNLRNLGLNVSVQAMDWGTLVARRLSQQPTSRGGWSMYHYVTTTAELMNPIGNMLLDAKGRNGGFPGWPENAQLETLRDQFAREGNDSRQKEIAEAIQKEAYDVVTHVPGGQFRQPVAHDKRLKGIVPALAPLFWNVEKT